MVWLRGVGELRELLIDTLDIQGLGLCQVLTGLRWIAAGLYDGSLRGGSVGGLS